MPTADELAEQFLAQRKKAKSADDLAAEFMARRPKASAPSADELGEQFLAQQKPKPERRGLEGSIFARFPPPPAATSTPPSKIPLADLKGYPVRPSAPPGTFARQEQEAAAFRAGEGHTPTYQKTQAKARAKVAGPVADVLVRLGSSLYPTADLFNKLAEEKDKLSQKYGDASKIPPAEENEGVLRAFRRWTPWQAFKKGLGGEATEMKAVSTLVKNNKALRKWVKYPAVGDAILSFAADIGPGKLQDLAAGGLARAVGKPALAAAERAVPKLGKAMETRRAYRAAQKEMSLGLAGAEKHGRRVAEIAEDVKQTTARAKKAGAQVRVIDPITKRPVNVLDGFIADFVEAGSLGSRHQAAKPTRPAIAEMGLGPKAAGAVRAGVQGAEEFGARVTQSARTAGRQRVEELVATGTAETEALRKELTRIGSTTGVRVLDDLIRRGRAKDLPRGSWTSPPTGDPKAFLAKVLEAARKGGAAKARELLEAPVGQQATRDAARQRITAAGKAGGDRVRELLETEAQHKAGVAAQKGRISEAAGPAGAQRVDDLAQGVAPTERQGPIWAERGEMATRRAEELPKIRAEAEAAGIDFADVERLGERYRALGDEIGQELVDLGRLSPEAFERLRGVHLPRYYMLRATKPRDAEKLLKEIERKGLITPEAAGDLRREMGGAGRRGGRDFSAAREIEEFGERLDPAAGRIAAPGATPAFARYTASAQREIGEARALEAMSRNPNLMVSRANATPEQLSQWKTVKGGGKQYDEMLVHPGVDRFLEMREKAMRQPETWGGEAWAGTMRAMRRWWISAPRTAANNAAGNYALGKSAAEINGARYSVPGYGAALKEWRQHRKGGTANPVLQEALDQTDILAEGSSVLTPDVKDFGAGFGVEGFAQRELAALKGLPQMRSPMQTAYLENVYQDVEKAGRYYLYKELRRAGKSVDEARDIVQAAMIDYSDVGPALRFLDQNNIFPFLTFPTKAIFQYANMAARRPDLLQTFSGERLRDVADAMADELNPEAGAKEKRRTGAVNLMEIPLPGKLDERGQQRYLRAPLASPVLQMFPANPDADVVSDRILAAAPVVRIPQELASNRSLYTGREIVPPGMPPGMEPWMLKGMHAAKGLFPQVSDLTAGYHALTDTQPYASPFAPVPRGQDVLLRFLTGASEREGSGESSVQGKLRAAGRMTDPVHRPFQEHATSYFKRLQAGEVQPDPRLVAAIAAKYTKLHEAQMALKDAQGWNWKLLTTSYKTGEDRTRAVEAQMQRIYLVSERVKELAGSDPGVEAAP